MEVKLYDRNLVTPSLIEDLTYQHEGMSFSTRLNGGYSQCSFRLKRDLPEAYLYARDKFFYRLVITDAKKTLWEGRLQRIELSKGMVSITAFGYWASLRDQAYQTAYNADADVVIKAALTAAAPAINADQTNIGATGGPAITSGAGEGYLDITVQELVDKLLAFGDTSGDTWFFAIWEDRIPYMFERDLSAVTWQCDLGQLYFPASHR